MTSHVALSPGEAGKAGRGPAYPPCCPGPRGFGAVHPCPEDGAGWPAPLMWGRRVRAAHTPASCSFCAAVLLFCVSGGMLFIIFPLDLINPRSVMSLEISIKHIVTRSADPVVVPAPCSHAGCRRAGVSRWRPGLGADCTAGRAQDGPGESCLLRKSQRSLCGGSGGCPLGETSLAPPAGLAGHAC